MLIFTEGNNVAGNDIAARVAKYRRTGGRMGWFDRLSPAKQKRAIAYLKYFKEHPTDSVTAIAQAMNEELGTNVRYDLFQKQLWRVG